MSTIGYVVVTYNQAGGYPETDGEIYWDRQNAAEQAEYARQETAKVGRGETHEVGLLVTIDEED